MGSLLSPGYLYTNTTMIIRDGEGSQVGMGEEGRFHINCCKRGFGAQQGTAALYHSLHLINGDDLREKPYMLWLCVQARACAGPVTPGAPIPSAFRVNATV